ncbi:extradiol dioxygenase [Burkholderia sp. Bp8998]|uniref:extradiol dioxygenase n=1 Tax=Burkholderia sp. Bp8998 TaxID=2184557 RepID=UPI000F5B0F3A|nr:extradiol dioxygenase [Burkholderia sp. Bp8998]RQS07087.1 extradiol dioxygenase [Burkholderia sp. Bp8998]
MHFDHVTIVTDDIDGTRRFFDEVVGLDTGPRPPFSVDGYWLYLDSRPMIHVTRATLPAQNGRSAPRIDHIALRLDAHREWETLIERLTRRRIDYTLSDVPLSNERQLFVSIAPGVCVEFVTTLATHGQSGIPNE